MDLDKISALVEAATPGPWGICLGSGDNLCTAISSEGVEDWDLRFTPICDLLPDWILQAEGKDGKSLRKDHRADMNFIAWTRTGIPSLVQRIRELEKENERLAALSASQAEALDQMERGNL